MDGADRLTAVLCPACGGRNRTDVAELPPVPVFCNVLHASAEAARRAARGDFRLAFCEDCGHLFNARFDPARVAYAPGYNATLYHSPRFVAYAEAVADRLVGRYGLAGGTVLEIGCGQGEFLNLICRRTGGTGIGFDPSYAGPEPPDRIAIVRDVFDERHAGIEADLIVCNHVIEHLAAPGALVGSLARILAGRPETVVYFEAPNALYTLRDLGIWDLIYEHCSYFTARSLKRLFASAGFEVLDLAPSYGDQFLGIEARLASVPPRNRPAPEMDEELRLMVQGFADAFRSKRALWNRALEDWRRSGRRVVVWGAGSKGVTFANLMDKGAARLAGLVDINPDKRGRYVAGVGLPVLAPSDLPEVRPDIVLLMNPLYRSEVEAAVRSLDLVCDLVEV